ncbi:MAG: PadR family transcriptional regulator [Acidobacteriota bacterium]
MKEINDQDQMTGDKWEIQLRKGCLELAILATLWSGKLYGLEILQWLGSDSDLIISEGTVYSLLNRLKTLGMEESEYLRQIKMMPAHIPLNEVWFAASSSDPEVHSDEFLSLAP